MGRRRLGRPKHRWDSKLEMYCRYQKLGRWEDIAQDFEVRKQQLNGFLDFCSQWACNVCIKWKFSACAARRTGLTDWLTDWLNSRFFLIHHGRLLIVWLNLPQNCTMLIGMWFYSVKPEVHVAVAFWMAGMFYTRRKLQHKQLERPYCCTENMFIELGRWHRSMRDLRFWICIMDVVVFDSFHCICPMQDIHWRTCELFMICYTLSWMKLSVYIIK